MSISAICCILDFVLLLRDTSGHFNVYSSQFYAGHHEKSSENYIFVRFCTIKNKIDLLRSNQKLFLCEFGA